MAQFAMMIFSIILITFYAALIIAYFIAWKKIPFFKYKEVTTQDPFSIVIAMRNEADNLTKCLQSIINQNYPTQLFEIIIIDDHSADNTSAVAQQFIDAHPTHQITLLHMQDDPKKGEKKKAAITFGISKAKGKHIILTDADCVRGNNWLSTINSFIIQTQSKMIYAPVLFNANTIFEKIQALEFTGLVAIGGAAIEIKKPNMCSAANLIFEKEVFYEVDGYYGVDHISSGDDEYLLHKVFKKYPNNIHFLKNNEAIVYTSANSTLAELASQRKRWVSKSTKYENKYITAILVAAYLFNASIVYYLFMAPLFGLLLLGIKAFVEGIFLYDVLKFFKRKSYILFLPLAEPFHILYVLIIGIWANMGTYNWKDRDLN